MKSTTLFIALFSVSTLAFIACEDQDNNGINDLPETIDLVDVNNNELGEITLTSDAENGYASFTSDAGYSLESVNFWVTKVPGDTVNFLYNISDDPGDSEYFATFPLDLLAWPSELCESAVYLSGWAVLRESEGERISVQIENTMVDGEPCNCTEFVFERACTTNGNGNSGDRGDGCETAFGFGDTTFIEAGLTNGRWGWFITVTDTGEFEVPIYAGAGRNDTTKASNVGTLAYSYDGQELNVTFDLVDAWSAEESHLYVSTDRPRKIAPGQYKNSWKGNGKVDGLSYTIDVDATNGQLIYIIAHAGVCPSDGESNADDES